MGLNAATLGGHRVTRARACIPAWGCWYADASVDGEITLSGSVELVIADLTLKGTILSGGPAKGRSDFRIVGGAGGWGRLLPRRMYTNDAGVKLSTVLGDAAEEAGETLVISANAVIGPAWTRPAGRASSALELLAQGAWYVGEDGVTRLGRRAPSALTSAVTHGPVDLARGTVTLAGDAIAQITPGLVVDGLEAVDVEHEISHEAGIRSTVWGPFASSPSRRLSAMRAIAEQLNASQRFARLSEYRVVTREGARLNLQPVKVSTGMPDLRRVIAMPGVGGCEVDAKLGSRVLVGFVDADPSRPVVMAYENLEGEGFSPAALRLHAGGMVAGEHVATVEAVALLVFNVLAAIGTAGGGAPITGTSLKLAALAGVNAALAAQAAPAPVGLVAQTAAAAAGAAAAAAGTPTNTSAPFASAISAIASKTPNVSGQFPSLGSAAIEAG